VETFRIAGIKLSLAKSQEDLITKVHDLLEALEDDNSVLKVRANKFISGVLPDGKLHLLAVEQRERCRWIERRSRYDGR